MRDRTHRWRTAYEYIVNEEAVPDGAFDEGHGGMRLADFQELARQRGTRLTLVEVGVTRMYTQDFFEPWNNALRELDESGQPDGGAGLDQWATCIAVLFSAIIKLSSAPVLTLDVDSGQMVSLRKVWRGVREQPRALPPVFLEPCEANQFNPSGAEMAFSSTTTESGPTKPNPCPFSASVG